jgi:hypothetical protein
MHESGSFVRFTPEVQNCSHEAKARPVCGQAGLGRHQRPTSELTGDTGRAPTQLWRRRSYWLRRRSTFSCCCRPSLRAVFSARALLKVTRRYRSPDLASPAGRGHAAAFRPAPFRVARQVAAARRATLLRWSETRHVGFWQSHLSSNDKLFCTAGSVP